jgi:hypothetical protein
VSADQPRRADLRVRERARSALRAAREPPYKPAIVIVGLAILFGGLFVASYSLALGRPKPHHIATATVGLAPADRPLIAAIERATGSSLDLHRVPSEAAARDELAREKIYAALVLRPGTPQLLVASAAGSSVARTLEQAVLQIVQQRGPVLRVQDTAPLPREDPQGLVLFYTTLAATIIGFVSMFQLRANAKGLPLKAWLACAVALAVGTGLMLTLVTGPVIGALRGSFPEKWAIISLESLTAALVTSALVVWVHRWALVPVWLLFIVLGNTSSGGPVAPPLLPPVYAFIGRWLSPGATVNALRDIVYFPQAQHVEPVLVLVAWATAGLVGLLAAVRLTGRTPA